MKRILALVLSLGVLAGPALAQPSGIQRNGPYIDVWNHRGGNVVQMLQTREDLGRSGREVRIRGYCRSACTMLITLPNACLGPHASVGFHAPRLPGTRIIPPHVDQIMGSTYRNGIRDRWFGGWNRSINMQVISARDYVRLDPQTRICDSLATHEQRTRRN
ncbi:hypothetical protein [Paracoccus sp. (in: a-proteobacteria)]|uniref:hypothetical protein n=1 Tax=Paracoccus sp. TaxID=267 RepID=UPI00272A36D1|nr:hypothetical protein [Paracoccus sp. (in: a-proteobacteria)]